MEAELTDLGPGLAEWLECEVEEDTRTIWLFAPIEERLVSRAIRALTWFAECDEGAPIHVRISSGGGSAWDGLALTQAIAGIPTPVYTYVQGLAASAAAIIWVAGDKRFADPCCEILFHGFAPQSDGHERGPSWQAEAQKLQYQANWTGDFLHKRAARGSPEYWRSVLLGAVPELRLLGAEAANMVFPCTPIAPYHRLRAHPGETSGDLECPAPRGRVLHGPWPKPTPTPPSGDAPQG